MKRIKSFISLLLAFTMLMSIAPMSFAEDTASINIETTAGYYNIEEPMSFYAQLPADYIAIRVYADGTQADADIEELADNRCKITIPANSFTKYPYAKITVEAACADGNKTAETTVNTFKPETTMYDFSLDMSEWDVETYGNNLVREENDKGNMANTTAITNLMETIGFYDSNIQDTTIVRKTGLGGKSSDDVSFALAGPHSSGSPYIAFRPERGTFYPVVVDASFSLYPYAGEGFDLGLRRADGNTKFLTNFTLTPQVWNNVSLQINLAEGKLTYQIDNGTNIISHSDVYESTGVTYLRFRLYPENNAESFIAIDDINVKYYEAIENRFALTSPANGENITNTFTAKATAIDVEKVYLYVDGVKSAEQTGKAGKQNYSFTLSPADIGYGDKEIRIVAVYADGTMDSESAVVSLKKVVENAVDTNKPTTRIDFNNMADWKDRVITSTDNKTMKNDYTWYVDNGAKVQKVSRVSGPSGKENDYALEVVASDAAKDTSNIRLYFDNSSSNLNMDGSYNMDFDMKVNTSEDSVRIVGPNLWARADSQNNTFISKGKIAGTNYTVTPDKWYHYNLRFEDNLWYVTRHEYDANGNPVNEELVVNGEEQIAANTPTKIYLVLMQNAAKGEGEEHAGFAIDNAKVWVEKSDGGVIVESLSYDNAQTVSNHTVPSTAASLTLNLDRTVTTDELSAELKINGVTVNADVTIDSAAVTVTLPELEAGSKLKVILKDKAETWADLSTFAYVSDENGLYTGCLDYFSNNSQFIAHTIAATNTRLSGIVASYADNSMTDVNVTDIFAPVGDSCTMLSAPNSVKTKVMIWDSMDTIKPVMKAYTLGE